jgi:sugar-specific transcriptional regulator TrmB
MANDSENRRAICLRVTDDHSRLKDDIERYSDHTLQLEPEIERLKSEISDKEQQLNSIVDLQPRIAGRPSTGEVIGTVVEAVTKEVMKSRIESQIRQLQATLSALSRKYDEATRLQEQARLNLDATANNFIRHGCAEFE